MITEFVYEFMGRRVDEMTREQLLEAFYYVARELREHTSDKARHQRALGAVEMLKRGERK